MTNAPNPTDRNLAREITRFLVRLGPEDGNDPTASDEVDWLHPVIVARTAGGSELDFCQFQVDLTQAPGSGRLQDIDPGAGEPIAWNRRVEIRVPAEDEDASEEAVFWGELEDQVILLGPAPQESHDVIARLVGHHFGDQLQGTLYYDDGEDAEVILHEDPTFNPLIDGIVESNRSDYQSDSDTGNAPDAYVWLDPESVRTSEAEDLHNQTASQWSLSDAVDTLLWWLNADQDQIDNPEVGEDFFSDANPIQNVVLRRGGYLPDYLDQLLQPNGFNWYVSYNLDDSDNLKPRIVFYRRGEGVKKQLDLQAPEEDLDTELSSLLENQLEVSIFDLANVITGHGSLEEWEVTVELYRAWPEADDSLDADQLRRHTSADDGYSQFADKPNVWRKWVANEAGDYQNTRTTVVSGNDHFAIPADHLDLSAVFSGSYVPRRRRFGPTLTLDESKRRQHPVVEWRPDSNSPWAEVPPQWSYRVLATEMGIYFTGTTPPEELLSAGQTAQVRVTGTIVGDQRLTHTVDRDDRSPNIRNVELFLDLSDRFHQRTVRTTGPLKSALTDRFGTDEVDDQTDLEDYLTTIQADEDAANMTARIRLFGIRNEYEISDLLTHVEGRGILLDRYTLETPDSDQKLLQVTGVIWNYAQQTTDLLTEAV